jgi:hypothetical protein
MAGENFVPNQGNCIRVISPGSARTKFGVFKAEHVRGKTLNGSDA